MSTGRNWRRAKQRRPTENVNVRFPRDPLGKRAKVAFQEWKAGLSKKQREILYTAPTR